jgi:hypothetical protein
MRVEQPRDRDRARCAAQADEACGRRARSEARGQLDEARAGTELRQGGVP